MIARLCLAAVIVASAAQAEDDRLHILPDGEPQWVGVEDCYGDPCEPERFIYAGLKLDYQLGEDEEQDRIETAIGMYAEISFDEFEDRVVWSSRTPDHRGLFNIVCAIPERYRYDIKVMTLDAEDRRLPAEDHWDELDEYALEQVVELGGRSCKAPSERARNPRPRPAVDLPEDPDM